MNVSKEITLLLDILQISEEELAKELDVSFLSVNNWKNNLKQIDNNNINKLYDFAYKKCIYLNRIFEQLLKEENSKDDSIVLFLGARKDFSLPININHNHKETNDFGKGFYLGESLYQAASYISNSNQNLVYTFKLDMNDLNVYKFDANKEWMLAISYYRNWLNDYDNSKVINKILSSIENVDVIIAPIADNRMFSIIGEFAEGIITDEQCIHALAATDLGKQYVLKTDKAVNKCSYLKELYISSLEKKDLIDYRFDITSAGINKAKMARIEYRGKGKYVEELLK